MADSDFHAMPLVLGGLAGVLSAGGLWAYSVFAPRCQFWAPVIRSLPQREAVALTFNDGPHPEFTPKILEILARHGARATFFVIGRHAEAHPELIRQIHAGGHGIGNHTYDHAPFRLRDRGYWERQIERTQRVVGEITGVLPVMFRSTGGYKTRELAAAMKSAGLPMIGWSVRAREAAAEVVARQLIGGTSGHDIVLLHDGAPPHAPASRQYMVDALPAYLQGIAEKKLQIVDLAEALVSASAAIRAGVEKVRTRAASS